MGSDRRERGCAVGDWAERKKGGKSEGGSCRVSYMVAKVSMNERTAFCRPFQSGLAYQGQRSQPK